MELSISNREIKPQVVNLFQFENGTTTLTFSLDSYKYEEVDLRNYVAFAITSIKGQVDMTKLDMVYDADLDTLKLIWDVKEYSLRHEGAVNYQICFKEDVTDGENTAVFYSYKGIILNRVSLDADNHLTSNYPTILKQWLDLINNLAGTYDAEVVYMQPKAMIPVVERLAGRLYYQIEDTTTHEGHFEDHLGNELGGSSANYIPNADMDDLVAAGEYICGGTLTNTPLWSTYCMVRVTDSLSTNRIIQEVYVPLNDDTVRVFVRAATGGLFGDWSELSRCDYVNSLISDKDFEIESLTSMQTNNLTDLYIDTFEDTSSLSTVPDGYDGHLRQFNISGTSDMIFTTKKTSSARTQFWISVDHDNGVVTPQVSVDLGSTWTTLTNNALTTITSSSSFTVKLSLSGTMTLKNVAFGMK